MSPRGRIESGWGDSLSSGLSRGRKCSRGVRDQTRALEMSRVQQESRYLIRAESITFALVPISDARADNERLHPLHVKMPRLRIPVSTLKSPAESWKSDAVAAVLGSMSTPVDCSQCARPGRTSSHPGDRHLCLHRTIILSLSHLREEVHTHD